MYLIVMFYNIHLTNELKNDTARKKFDKYSLAYRFQLEENLKVFMLIKQVIISIGVYVLLNILAVIVSNSNYFSESFNLSMVFLVENCILLNPLLICTVTMCSVDPWRAILIRDIDILSCRLLRLNRTNIHRVRSIEEKMMAREETDIYFRDLKVMWA
uniref:Pecanex-like protein n=1 Tax=Caenorhabditis tropicalis TaxID=1561998 RepID=A0A1I7UGS9_9PELO